MNRRKSVLVPLLALLILPVFAQTGIPGTGEVALGKDCVANVDACFPTNGCVAVLGGSRWYAQENRERCVAGGKNCYDTKCYVVEFVSKGCSGPHEIISSSSRACGKRAYVAYPTPVTPH